ncbi:hypothetical protein GF327_03040, partial [Candidatus Woesearchaeota archaeon]|nr:hypothetical protein [Candidatus Woesearchaeota archaeon]
MKIKKLLTSPRIIIYLLFFLFMMLAISPNPWHKGATIRNVITNSTAYNAGITSSAPRTPPMNRETIVEINNQEIESADDYYEVIDDVKVNDTLYLKTKVKRFLFSYKTNDYVLSAESDITTKVLNETVAKKTIVEEYDEDLNKTVNKTKYVMQPKTEQIFNGVKDIGIRVYDAPKTNIKLGLDLQGGTRVILQPEEKISTENMDALIDNMNQRLNLYGLSDVVIRSAGDLSGNQFIIVEIAGATEEEVHELLAQQGKFEASIGNETVFLGGEDITYVCRSAQCSGIDPRAGCRRIQDGYMCRFQFAISLSSDAAKRQAEITQKLDVVYDSSGEEYLSQDLNLYLDDQMVDTLKISADLKGRASTEIAISGSGFGLNMQEARREA